MRSQDSERLLGEIGNLQTIIKERRNKREPFLSSFADALENVVKKAEYWFNEETELAGREIGILEELLPDQSFEEKKVNLQRYTKEFKKVTDEFNKTIESIRKGQIKSLKDFVEAGGLFQLVDPEFIGHLKKIYDICLKLEELIESLEDGAKYISIALRVSNIAIEGRKQG